MNETTPTGAAWTAEEFYAKASRPGNAPPTKYPNSTPAPATKTEAEARSEKFYEGASKVTPGVTGKAVQPTPAASPQATPAATATPAETAAIVSDLAALGVTIPEGSGLKPDQLVALNDKVLAAHRATQDAQTEQWAQESRRDLPPAEIESGIALVKQYGDAEVFADLQSSGLGSKKSFISLAAKLSRAISQGR